jgi:hypothetical protein
MFFTVHLDFKGQFRFQSLEKFQVVAEPVLAIAIVGVVAYRLGVSAVLSGLHVELR